MNIKEYIESGILEAYILGALTPDEEALVEANIAKFPELGDELLTIETAMERYSATLATEPPAGLQDKIWDAIQNNSEVNKTRKTIPFQPAPIKRAVEFRYAAALAALIVSVALNIFFWNKGNHASDENIVLNGKMDTLQNQQKQLAQLVTSFQKEKSMMADTAMQTIVMHTVQPGHPMAATVYWSKKEGIAYVAVDALPEPPKGMQYQLWVMQDGKPVDMGVISNEIANTPVMQRVAKVVTTGQAFAISLEKEGGSPTPTMQNIYVMGAAS